MRARALVILMTFVGLVAACGDEPPRVAQTGIRLASFDFTESAILTEIYAGALEEEGYDVLRIIDVGPRELVAPALEQGEIDFVPEYLGTALDFASLGRTEPTSDTDLARARLSRALRPKGIEVLAPAPAQNQNGIAVTTSTAQRLELETISDLATDVSELTFGGPPECPERPFCLQGLERLYDLHFRDFVPLDSGGPVTATALEGGEVDVALLFTTDGRLRAGNFVLLRDDRHLQPAENIVPVVRRDVVQKYGQEFVDTIDSVSRRLSTSDLVDLNALADLEGDDAADVARDWLEQEGLI